jgi:hypothetical protein
LTNEEYLPYEPEKESDSFGLIENDTRIYFLARAELRNSKHHPLPKNLLNYNQFLRRLGPINLPIGRLFVEEVIMECRKHGATRVDVLTFELEMGLFPAALEESQPKSIDIAPKTIPPEVFDKRAVEKGQVRFVDIAYVERPLRATTRRTSSPSASSSRISPSTTRKGW